MKGYVLHDATDAVVREALRAMAPLLRDDVTVETYHLLYQRLRPVLTQAEHLQASQSRRTGVGQ